MNAEKAIFAILSGNAAVIALTSTRIYPVKLPQKVTLPAITYFCVDAPRVHSLIGASGLASPRIQVDCYATTYAGAQDLADKIRIALDTYRGVVAGINVQGILLLSESDLSDAVEGLVVTDEYRRSMDFRVWHQE